MQLYRFSPIESKEKLLEVIEYVANQTMALCRKILGKELPITSLTIFAHYTGEYEKLISILSDLGKPHNENNGPRITMREPLNIGKNSITHLRIRKPDPYRAQVGCNDADLRRKAQELAQTTGAHDQLLKL